MGEAGEARAMHAEAREGRARHVSRAARSIVSAARGAHRQQASNNEQRRATATHVQLAPLRVRQGPRPPVQNAKRPHGAPAWRPQHRGRVEHQPRRHRRRARAEHRVVEGVLDLEDLVGGRGVLARLDAENRRLVLLCWAKGEARGLGAGEVVRRADGEALGGGGKAELRA